tara:strand:- start:85 stop:297 length:213 start_codon:yes stop_codon:yes gene_type:complete
MAMTIFYALNALFFKAHSTPAISIRATAIIFWLAESINTPFTIRAIFICRACFTAYPFPRVRIRPAAFAN